MVVVGIACVSVGFQFYITVGTKADGTQTDLSWGLSLGHAVKNHRIPTYNVPDALSLKGSHFVHPTIEK